MPGPARGLLRYTQQHRAQAHERHLVDVMVDVQPVKERQGRMAASLRAWLDAGTPKHGATFDALHDTLETVEQPPRPKKRKR